MSQPLPAGTGVLTGNEPDVAADLLAARKPIRSPDDESVDQRRDGSHPRMRHQQHHLGPLMGFSLNLLLLTPQSLDPAGLTTPIILSDADWPTEPTRVSLAGRVPVH